MTKSEQLFILGEYVDRGPSTKEVSDHIIHMSNLKTVTLLVITVFLNCINKHLYSQEEFPALKNELDYKYNHLLDLQSQSNE